MAKRLKLFLIVILLALLALFLLQKIRWLPSFPNLFNSKPLLIDETPVLVKEINNLAQLITITMYDEVVMESSKPKRLPSFPGLRPVPDKIVLIAKSKVLAGVDLSKIKANDILINQDSISLRLPSAQIFSAIINPSDFETFEETGSWTVTEVNLLKIKMRRKVIERARQAEIFAKASKKAKAVMESFLLSAGFKKVMVSTRQ